MDVKELHEAGLFFGLYRGIVKSNDDSGENYPYLGRVKIYVPQVYGEQIEDRDLPWASPCFSIPAGKKTDQTPYGMFFQPEVGSPAWVAFEHGDPRRPVYLGGWLGQEDLPRQCRELYTGTFVIFDGSKDGQRFMMVREDRIEIVANGTTDKLSRITLRQDGPLEVICDSEDLLIRSYDAKVTLLSGRGVNQQSIEIDPTPGAESTTIRGKRLVLEGTDVEVRATNDLKFSARHEATLSTPIARGFDQHP